MVIKFHDDGKGRDMSYEATIQDDRVNLTAYGANRSEAAYNLSLLVKQLAKDLNTIQWKIFALENECGAV